MSGVRWPTQPKVHACLSMHSLIAQGGLRHRPNCQKRVEHISIPTPVAPHLIVRTVPNYPALLEPKWITAYTVNNTAPP